MGSYLDQFEGFMLWTEREGGTMKAKLCMRQEYEEALETGVKSFSSPDDPDSEPILKKWHWIAFGQVEDNFDKGLGRSREATLGGAIR